MANFVNKNDVPGWLFNGDLIALGQLASNLSENNIIVEIGSLHGKSAVQMAKSTTASIYCFDLWDGRSILSGDGFERINDLETFQSFTKEYPNIKSKRVNKSPNSADWGEQLVDLIFIDAAHSNPSDWELIEYWMPKIKKGGILCGHDFFQGPPEKIAFPDVNENVAKLEKILDQKVKIYEHSLIWSFKI
jgi:hypothetical protein